MPKNATRRPSTGSAGRGAAPSRRPARPAATSSRTARGDLLVVRVGLGHREHDEVGEQQPVGVQVAGRDGRILVRADDEHAPPVATGGSAAPLPSKTTSSGPRLSARRAPSSTFETTTAPASPPPQRRQPTVSTPAERGGLEVVGGRVAAGARELDERLDGRRHPNDLRLGRPAAPHRDDDDAPVLGRGGARRSPVTAVFPTRFPVPTTASDGSANGRERRRLEAEVGPLVRHAEREHAARERASARRARARARRRGRARARAVRRRSPPRCPPRAARRSPRRRAASRCRRRAPRRRRRAAPPRARRARPGRSARRRSRRPRGSPSRRDLALDPARVLLVLEGRRSRTG